ncbi:MAG: UvrB/UvrC motif-containing protein, partial [Chlamydiales bacterium]|nr:UvrB/UvrC motif-containing protein [Chlamydiales bacterium]
ECYSVFSDLLITELASAHKLPAQLKKSLSSKKGQAIHVGKSPGSDGIIPASSQLTTLNEALNDALKIENYEQAAWLRDQIKALTEKTDEGKK